MASPRAGEGGASGGDYAKVYGRILRQVKEPVIIHWPARCSILPRGLIGATRDHMQAMDVAIERSSGQRRQGRRRQGLAARQGQGDRHAPRLPQGVRMYTGTTSTTRS